jgi:hypothetical protein
MYLKSSCEYGVGKKKKLLKDINMQRHLPMPFHLGID